MNKKESLALYKKGRDAWNAWAEEMLAERQALEEAGEWQLNSIGQGQNEATAQHLAAAAADFAEHAFEDDADFTGFVFPGDASFNSVTFSSNGWFNEAAFLGNAWFYDTAFSGDAWFKNATFSGTAKFDSTAFSGTAWFNNATFSGTAWYEGAEMSGDTWFESATFSGDAWFTLCQFEGYTVFEHTRFERESGFYAIRANSAFILAGATFLTVPNFIQAHFSEPPRLEVVRIAPRGFRAIILGAAKDYFRPSPERSIPLAAPLVWQTLKALRDYPSSRDPDHDAHWRWLKKLAVDGHDHGREQEFFRGELLAQRGFRDRWFHARYWFGWAYQVLSDFGRSLWLPLVWLGVSIGGFAAFYLSKHQSVTGPAAGDACLGASGDPMAAAVGLSLRNTLLFASAGLNDKLTQIHGCLWGWQPAAPGSARQVPAIPDIVAILGVAQNLLSAVLIFLFLLAVRNHFRIK